MNRILTTFCLCFVITVVTLAQGYKDVTGQYIKNPNLESEEGWTYSRVNTSGETLTWSAVSKSYSGSFVSEIYAGPLFISDRILLSHEPVYGLTWCLNIHGHDHNGVEAYSEGCKHINLAANVCGYTPVNLGKLIKDGILSDIESIHRMTIDRAVQRRRV